jgi:hypothetical protein
MWHNILQDHVYFLKWGPGKFKDFWKAISLKGTVPWNFSLYKLYNFINFIIIISRRAEKGLDTAINQDPQRAARLFVHLREEKRSVEVAAEGEFLRSEKSSANPAPSGLLREERGIFSAIYNFFNTSRKVIFSKFYYDKHICKQAVL